MIRSDPTSFLLQYAGLSWGNIQTVLQQTLGAGNLAAAGKVAEFVSGFNKDTLPDFLNKIGINFDALKTELLNKAQDTLNGSLLSAAPRILAKFFGVGVPAMLYDGLTWLLDNSQQLGDVFKGFLNSIDDLVKSVEVKNPTPAQAAAFQNSLVRVFNDAVPILIKFAAAQLGIANLPQELGKALQFIPNKVDAALRAFRSEERRVGKEC